MQIAKIAPNWIKDGEKFALIGLPVALSPDISNTELPGGLTILPHADFQLPEHWREWLGTIRIEDISDCCLFLVARMASTSLGILDDEDQKLSRLVDHWYTGLTLTSKFETSDAIFKASGSCEDSRIEIRQFMSFDPPLGSIVNSRDSISMDQLKHASEIARGLLKVAGSPDARNWRLLRCLRLYQETRCNRDILERTHQFTRCVEGLIAPEQGNTKKQFKSRTETFIGPKYHDLMGDLYDLRSDVEHLNENLHLEEFDREARIHIAKLEATSEWIARSCLKRIVLDPILLNHFGNVTNIINFWTLNNVERQKIWGSPVDPESPFKDFNFKYVSDGELGANE